MTKVSGSKPHPQIKATFAEPTDKKHPDRKILDQVVQMIKDTPKGATIRAAIHSLSDNKVQRALQHAHERGVHVVVVQDGKNKRGEDPSGRELAKALNTPNKYGEKGVNVWGKDGAITNDKSGIMHTKLMLFSKTKVNGVEAKDVSWFGSANFTAQTGAKTFNNTLTVADDKNLYKGFKDYFQDLREKKHVKGNDYFDGHGRGAGRGDKVKFYASPDANHDPVAKILNDIKPKGAKVLVDQAMIFNSRGNLVKKLADLKEHGADVRVVANHIHGDMRRELRKAHIPLSIAKTHDKTIAINADLKSDKGNDKVKMVVTGSHNWTKSANTKNDELLVSVKDDSLFKQYKKHFETAFERGDRVGKKGE
jgi:phosphatidylserine/phosphatidylglycerophosphate/cardiolipin synthase-like enzyme